jgi:hypothetical protein
MALPIVPSQFSTTALTMAFDRSAANSTAPPSKIVPDPQERSILVVGPKFEIPLQLSVKQLADGLVLVTHATIKVYGTGETEEKAVVDFIEMLDDHLGELTDSEDELGPGLRRELDTLRTIVK